MRIISLNLNGIRSAIAKGCLEWLHRQNADVICFQETKAHLEAIPRRARSPQRYHAYFACAEKKGYSGVGIYTRREPDRVITCLDWPHMDDEGRYIQVDFGKLSIVSIYVPSGSSGEIRQARKFEVMNALKKRLRAFRRDGREYILAGDWNIAHREIDLKNWRSNRKNSGFLPEERAFMEEVFGRVGFVDAFRVVNQEPGHYTFWSNRGASWARNVGWRIDYQVITPGLRDRVCAASIYKRRRFGDHAPLTIDYAYDL
jgi:exodeoxyribonuclease III